MGRNDDGWFTRFQQRPQTFAYIQVMRMLVDQPEVIRQLDIRPQDTGLYQEWSVVNFSRQEDRYTLTVNRPALTGKNSSLPNYIVDAVRYCSYDLDQRGLEAFFQIFNQRVLKLDYQVSVAGYLPLYTEYVWARKRTLPTNFINFMGITGGSDHLWLLPYTLRSQIQTRAISSVDQIISHGTGMPVRVEHERVSRWLIMPERRWRLTPSFHLHRNTLLGSCAWVESEIIRVVIRVTSRTQLNFIRTNTQLQKRLKILTNSLLPFHFINYILELSGNLAERPRISAQTQTYRLSYHCGGSEIPEGYVWQALAI